MTAQPGLQRHNTVTLQEGWRLAPRLPWLLAGREGGFSAGRPFVFLDFYDTTLRLFVFQWWPRTLMRRMGVGESPS